jgi:hypothetical protein
MENLYSRMTPTDLIAIIIIIGSFVLLRFGMSDIALNMIMMIIGVYFGKKQIIEKKIGPILAPKAKEDVESIIRRVARLNKVDEELAVRVARCESALKIKAVNVNSTGTKDRGIFQWNDFYHPEVTDAMAFDPEIATKLFCDAIKKGHLSWWNASKSCWNKN